MAPAAPQAGVATAGSNIADASGAAEAMDVDTAGKLTKQQPESCSDALATSHQSIVVLPVTAHSIGAVVLQTVLSQVVALNGGGALY